MLRLLAYAQRPRVLVALSLVLAVLFWGTLGTAAVLTQTVLDGVPDRRSLGAMTKMARASVFYDAQDRPAFTIYKEQRIEVPLDAVAPHLTQAILAIEDQRFYEHPGIDLVRIGGAMVANLRQGRVAQGGSTLTQQLARQSFLTLDKTLTRKAQEVLLALLIERAYAKDEILELYLNKVYFGAGLYGAEAASLGYFGKRAADLSVAEAALLAGLVKAPSNYAPTVNLERATDRRAVVLQAMHEMGAIDENTREAARRARVRLKDALRKEEPFGQYFKEHVRVWLVEQFGREAVYEGGLQVYTTIDLATQKAAETAVARTMKDIDARRDRWLRRRAKVARASTAGADAPAATQAALVALDPHTGHVRALVGGRDFAATKFNRVTQARRQPGSAFKPFVYAAALEAGYSPAYVINRLNEPIDTDLGAWMPEDGHSRASALTMRAALRNSSNRAAVRMLEEVGIRSAAAYARRMGVGDVPEVPSLALGSGEVTLESLTSAFGVFANDGVRRPAVYVRRVVDADGTVLYQAPDDHVRVVSPATAFLMSHMLADVINHGTAWKARQAGFTLPAAGKTGTTNDYFDAWFVGYTPSLVAGVWVGLDQPQTILPGAYAADLAVPVWAAFMKRATARHTSEWFTPPDDVVGVSVCRLSGKRPAEGCDAVPVETEDGYLEHRSMVFTEYFAKGTAPGDTCPLHVGRSFVDRFAGWFGIERGPNPAPVPAGEVPGTRAGARDREAQAEPEEPKKKKRGFWSRIFGRGDREPEKPPRRPPPR